MGHSCAFVLTSRLMLRKDALPTIRFKSQAQADASAETIAERRQNNPLQARERRLIIRQALLENSDE